MRMSKESFIYKIRTPPFNLATSKIHKKGWLRAAVKSRGTAEVHRKTEGRVEGLTLWDGRRLHGIERECLCLCREKTNFCCYFGRIIFES